MKTFFLVIFLLIVVVILSGLGWHYRAGLKIVADTLISPYDPLVQKVKPILEPKPSPPPKWGRISIPSARLSLSIPPDWVFDNHAEIKSALGKNAISISTNSGLLVPSVFNPDLFHKIYNLKTGGEFTEENFGDEIKFKKIGSGKILTGQPFTVFVWDYSNTQTAARMLMVRAFILKDTTLIIFTLNKSTDEDIEFLKKIVGFSSLN